MAEPETMQRTEGESNRKEAKENSGPDTFLIVCRCFSFITIVAVLCCIGVNILSAVRSFKNVSDRQKTCKEQKAKRAVRLRLKSRPDPFLVICGCFSFITIAAVLCCIIVNVLSAVRSFKNGSDIYNGIFRCYAVVIGLLAVAAETEWSFIINYWKVLEYWVGRGMLQIFVAVMTKAYPGDFENHKDIILLQSIASYMLLSCGVIYIVSGLLCIGHFKRARQKKEVNRDQAVKDLQDLERRREELQALLLMDERV